MTDIPQCKLCTAPMFQTASGAWVCPICDRNVPLPPTEKKEKP